MFHDIFSSNVIFRIINFAAFMGLFAFLFKRKLLPSIKKQIQEKKLLLQNLEQQKQGVKYQHSNLDNAIEQQEHLAIELQKKIMLWQMQLKQEQEQLNKQKTIMQEAIKIKAQKQKQERALKQLNKIIAPRALEQVEHTMKQEFADNARNEAFIRDIIIFIQESTQ